MKLKQWQITKMIRDLLSDYIKGLKKLNVDELADELTPCGDCDNNDGFCDRQKCKKHIIDAYFLTAKAQIAKTKALRRSIFNDYPRKQR